MTVIGGHEEEQESGVTTLDSDFLTVLLRGSDCEGNFVNDRAIGSGEFRMVAVAADGVGHRHGDEP